MKIGSLHSDILVISLEFDHLIFSSVVSGSNLGSKKTLTFDRSTSECGHFCNTSYWSCLKNVIVIHHRVRLYLYNFICILKCLHHAMTVIADYDLISLFSMKISRSHHICSLKEL